MSSRTQTKERSHGRRTMRVVGTVVCLTWVGPIQKEQLLLSSSPSLHVRIQARCSGIFPFGKGSRKSLSLQKI